MLRKAAIKPNIINPSFKKGALVFCSPGAGFLSFLLQHALRQARGCCASHACIRFLFFFFFPGQNVCDTQPGIYENSHLAGILCFTRRKSKRKSGSSDWRKKREKVKAERKRNRKTERKRGRRREGKRQKIRERGRKTP